jgi:amino acid permease
VSILAFVLTDLLQFYMVSLTVVGCLVPYTDPDLLNGTGSSDANASPFVIAVRNAGIGGIPSVMNVVIMIAVLSVGNSSIYGSSRTLAALADRGQAPKILAILTVADVLWFPSCSLPHSVSSATSLQPAQTREHKHSIGC